ncbi:FMRFamide receptor [Orchesella cincta]|uniref:FMRFamide receptor n=1 Tax=Orchesella cincta TaxID=48709 RepID=A0A1D2MEZ6_ORCCI|nr:FMRFamide receptor [Orchesella cincta]
MALLVGKTWSAYMTVLISVERLLGIAFPFHAIKWFTLTRAKYYAAGVLIFTLTINSPRLFLVRIERNIYGSDGFNIPSLQGFRYLLKISEFALAIGTRGWVLLANIDYFLPVPLLLLLMFLSYNQKGNEFYPKPGNQSSYDVPSGGHCATSD